MEITCHSLSHTAIGNTTYVIAFANFSTFWKMLIMNFTLFYVFSNVQCTGQCSDCSSLSLLPWNSGFIYFSWYIFVYIIFHFFLNYFELDPFTLAPKVLLNYLRPMITIQSHGHKIQFQPWSQNFMKIGAKMATQQD